MKLLRNPAVLVILGLVTGLSIGLGWFWRAADTIAARVIAKRAAVEEAKKPAAPWGFWTIEIESLANELKDERARLKQQADQFDQREARFAAERQELDKVRAEIEGLRREIATKVVEIRADESKNLRTLAQTYTSLTPRAAVAIFKEMDDATVVKILSLMKSESVAPIFEEMSRAGADPALAKRAAALSEKLRVVRAARASGGS